MTDNVISQRLKSKTYWLGILVLIMAYAQQNFPMIEVYVAEYRGLIDFGMGIAILVIRELTKIPLSEKSKDHSLSLP